jgi:hypothetical protein
MFFLKPYARLGDYKRESLFYFADARNGAWKISDYIKISFFARKWNDIRYLATCERSE